MNPACRAALEAALRIREVAGAEGGEITAITMGPPMAEEVLREAIALGADRGILLTDRADGGADTGSDRSARSPGAIEKMLSGFDLVPAVARAVRQRDGPGRLPTGGRTRHPRIAYVDRMAVSGRTLRVQRLSDNFLETLEIDLPGLITVTTEGYASRYVPSEVSTGILRATIETVGVEGAWDRPGTDRGQGIRTKDPQSLLADRREEEHRPHRDA